MSDEVYQFDADVKSDEEALKMAWREAARSEGYEPTGDPRITEAVVDGSRVARIRGPVRRA